MGPLAISARPMDEAAKFSLSLDRKLHSDVLLVAIPATQDIIACCFSDQVACYRLNWQKIWVHTFAESKVLPSAICWRPDASLLAVGFFDGNVLLVETEKGEQHASVKYGTEKVTTLSWVEEEARTQAG